MNAVRRGAWLLLKYVTSLYFVGVIVQFFLVGYGLFDMKHGATIDDAKSLDPHRGFGFALTDLAPVLILVLVLVAWPKRRLLVSWILLAVLSVAQGLLAGFGFNHWVIGMFHPVNALVLLGLSGYLARYAWQKDRSADEVPAAIVGAG